MMQLCNLSFRRNWLSFKNALISYAPHPLPSPNISLTPPSIHYTFPLVCDIHSPTLPLLKSPIHFPLLHFSLAYKPTSANSQHLNNLMSYSHLLPLLLPHLEFSVLAAFSQTSIAAYLHVAPLLNRRVELKTLFAASRYLLLLLPLTVMN